MKGNLSPKLMDKSSSCNYQDVPHRSDHVGRLSESVIFLVPSHEG